METKRYGMVWRNKFLTASATSIMEMARLLREAAGRLEQMGVDGVVLEPDGGEVSGDYAVLFTTDPGVAAQHGLGEMQEGSYEILPPPSPELS